MLDFLFPNPNKGRKIALYMNFVGVCQDEWTTDMDWEVINAQLMLTNFPVLPLCKTP